MKTHFNKHRSERGVALMIVMLVVFTLTAIVAHFAYTMKVEMRLAQNDYSDADLEWMARGAVDIAKFAICQKPQGQQGLDALNQPWAGATGLTNDPLSELGLDLHDLPFGPNAHVSVTITDMERKWNINALANPSSPQPLVLQQALNIMGVNDPTEATTITESILDWVDRDDMHRFNGAENDYYTNLDPPYYCKDGFIDDLSELLRIKGITPDMYSATTAIGAYQMQGGRFPRDFEPISYAYHFDELFTTMGLKINVNTASAATLQLIPGVDTDIAQRIIQFRAGEDGVDGTDDDMPFQNVGQISAQIGMGLGGPGGPGMPPVGGFQPGQGAPPPIGMNPGMRSLQTFCDVRSYYFEVKVDAEMGGHKRTYYAIIHRPKNRLNDPEILRFYSD